MTPDREAAFGSLSLFFYLLAEPRMTALIPDSDTSCKGSLSSYTHLPIFVSVFCASGNFYGEVRTGHDSSRTCTLFWHKLGTGLNFEAEFLAMPLSLRPPCCLEKFPAPSDRKEGNQGNRYNKFNSKTSTLWQIPAQQTSTSSPMTARPSRTSTACLPNFSTPKGHAL